MIHAFAIADLLMKPENSTREIPVSSARAQSLTAFPPFNMPDLDSIELDYQTGREVGAEMGPTSGITRRPAR
jgi:hypothetical protein